MSLTRRILPIGEPFNNELSVKFEENLAFPTWAEGTYYTSAKGLAGNGAYTSIYRSNFNGYLIVGMCSGNHQGLYLCFYVYDDNNIAHEIQLPIDFNNNASNHGWDGSSFTIPIAKGVRWQLKPVGGSLDMFTFAAVGEVPEGATIVETITL